MFHCVSEKREREEREREEGMKKEREREEGTKREREKEKALQLQCKMSLGLVIRMIYFLYLSNNDALITYLNTL